MAKDRDLVKWLIIIVIAIFVLQGKQVFLGSFFDDTTRTDWISRYDTHNLNIHDGDGFLSQQPTSWAWDEADVLLSYVHMYAATKDVKYLDSIVNHTDVIIGAATIQGDGLLGWDGVSTSDFSMQGNIFRSVAEFVRFVNEDGLTSYQSKADEYQAFMEENIVPRALTNFREFENDGILMGSATEGTEPNMMAKPFNQQDGIGTMMLDLYAVTGNQEYRDYVLKQARYIRWSWNIKASPHTGNDYAYWGYRKWTGQEWDNSQGAWCEGDCEIEINYGNYDMYYIYRLANDGVIFTQADIDLVVNLIIENMWNQDAVNPIIWRSFGAYVKPAWANLWYLTGQIQGLTLMGKYDTRILEISEKVYDKMWLSAESTGFIYNWDASWNCIGDFVTDPTEYVSDPLYYCYPADPADGALRYTYETILGEAAMLRANSEIQPVVVCGNNVREAGEICDGTDLNDNNCTTVGNFTSGTLTCLGDCTDFDTSQCTEEEPVKCAIYEKDVDGECETDYVKVGLAVAALIIFIVLVK